MRITTSKIDVRNFGDMARDMMRRRGLTSRQVVEAEATTVLGTMVRRTKAAKVSAIVRRYQERLFTTLDSKKYFLLNRYPNALWSKIEAQRNASIQRALAARGMAKLSWLQIATALGLKGISTPAYVRRARGPNGPPAMGKGSTEARPDNHSVTLINESKVAQVTGGRGLLNRVIRGRVRQYRKAIEAEFRKDARIATSGRGGYVK